MPKQKIFLKDILEKMHGKEYDEIYKEILALVDAGKYQPIKRSGVNGKTPALNNAYWLVTPETDYSDVIDELQYEMNPQLDISYYCRHPDRYEKERTYAELLNSYIGCQKDNLAVPVTINERSFEIFHDEKYLDRKGGAELLAHVGLDAEKLNFYGTSEPMSYYSHSKISPQKFLIIENKDTFYSMRRHLIHCSDSIMGMKIGTLIYGSGKGIYKSFEDYIAGVEPYFADRQNELFYFGDLDYEGILIYETLCSKYDISIRLFTKAYIRMIRKAEAVGIQNLPQMKGGQNRNMKAIFMGQFGKSDIKIMTDILESGHYIPQEIINEMDYGI